MSTMPSWDCSFKFLNNRVLSWMIRQTNWCYISCGCKTNGFSRKYTHGTKHSKLVPPTQLSAIHFGFDFEKEFYFWLWLYRHPYYVHHVQFVIQCQVFQLYLIHFQHILDPFQKITLKNDDGMVSKYEQCRDAHKHEYKTHVDTLQIMWKRNST